MSASDVARTIARMVLTLTDGIALAWLVDGDEAAAKSVTWQFLSGILRLLKENEATGLVTLRPRGAGSRADATAATD